MNLKERIELMKNLGDYLKEDNDEWKEIKRRAFENNGWFTIDFIDLAVKNIIQYYLDPIKLNEWTAHYHLDDNIVPKKVGIVMAGNIPLVGFHDFLTVFISGHRQIIKMSSKDNILLKHLVHILILKEPGVSNFVIFADRLSGCDAYLTTGSNNTSRYFEYYFGKYPSIIRKNKTSVALLSGDETLSELEKLADDICFYFGLGCRNVTKLLVPRNYNFEPLLNSFSKYSYFTDHKKYRNNFDYYLTLQIMNNQYYMTNQVVLFIEKSELFSPISQVYYEFYDDGEVARKNISLNTDIQCLVGNEFIFFGETQKPGLFDYADKEDTMAFLLSI